MPSHQYQLSFRLPSAVSGQDENNEWVLKILIEKQNHLAIPVEQLADECRNLILHHQNQTQWETVEAASEAMLVYWVQQFTVVLGPNCWKFISAELKTSDHHTCIFSQTSAVPNEVKVCEESSDIPEQQSSDSHQYNICIKQAVEKEISRLLSLC